MTVRLLIGALLVAALWSGAATAVPGQGMALDDAQHAARLLEGATNLPKMLAPGSGLTTAAERREAFEAERIRLIEILRDDGYLKADIALQSSALATMDSGKLQARVDAGPRYTLGAVTVAATAAVNTTLRDEMQDIASAAVGSYADSGTLDDISERLKWLLGQNGHAFARIEPLDLVPIPDSAAAELAIRVTPGQPARFSGLDMAAVDRVLHDAVGSIVPFARGDMYSNSKAATFRDRLAALPGVADTRVEVVPHGPTGFALQIRAKRTYLQPSNTKEASLAFGVLIAALAVLALRQAAASSGFGRFPVRALTVASGGLLFTSGWFLAARVFALI